MLQQQVHLGGGQQDDAAGVSAAGAAGVGGESLGVYSYELKFWEISVFWRDGASWKLLEV